MKNNEVITYEMLIDNELVDGVFAISLVDSPAIQTDYILLSDKTNKIQIDLKLEKLADEKRKIVTGAALIPDMIIPRNGYNITFSKETIRKISENFLINGYKDNVTVQHTQNVNKVYMVESWIVDDPKNDKAKKLGFNVPEGTWMTSFKVKDDELWKEYIESGVLKGFSIEGSFSQKEVQMEEYDLDKALEEIVYRLAYTDKDLESYYKWELGEEKEGGHCPSCKKFNGEVKKLKDWINTAIPAKPEGYTIAGLSTKYPHSPYGTFCQQHCNCSLIKVTADVIRRSIKRPTRPTR